jgi:hypothetical protein
MLDGPLLTRYRGLDTSGREVEVYQVILRTLQRRIQMANTTLTRCSRPCLLYKAESSTTIALYGISYGNSKCVCKAWLSHPLYCLVAELSNARGTHKALRELPEL